MAPPPERLMILPPPRLRIAVITARHGIDGSQDVDQRGIDPFGPIDILERPHGAVDAGIVDQNIDAAKGLDRGLDQAIDIVGLRDIGRKDSDALAGSSRRTKPVAHLAEQVGAPGADHHGGPIGHIGLGDRDAETLAGALSRWRFARRAYSSHTPQGRVIDIAPTLQQSRQKAVLVDQEGGPHELCVSLRIKSPELRPFRRHHGRIGPRQCILQRGSEVHDGGEILRQRP